MATTLEHMERALEYLTNIHDGPNVYMAKNELENAIGHYHIENKNSDPDFDVEPPEIEWLEEHNKNDSI